MNRRGFLKLLGLGAGATAAGVVLPDVEPVRRWWQVGRGAPVPARDDGYLFGTGASEYERWRKAIARMDHGCVYDANDVAFSLDALAVDHGGYMGPSQGVNVVTYKGVPLARTPAGRVAIAEEFMREGLMTPEDAARVLVRESMTREQALALYGERT
jgi:hypothetical protein